MSKYYTAEDTACHCGCGYNPVSKTLLALLDDMSDAVGAKIEISSCCRCPEHNEAVGGVVNSQHVEGTAADLFLPDGWSVDEIAELAEKEKADGIGIYYEDEFVHVDVRCGRIGACIEWEG